MKRLLASLFLVLFVGACETQTFSALDEKSPEWRLVFQDEFSGRGRPDPDKWISKEYNRRPNDDGPDGWWDPTNAYLNGSGKLVLKTSVIENRNPARDDLTRRLNLGGTLEDVEDAGIAQDAADRRIPAQSRCRRGSAGVVGAAQATRAPSSLAIPASRSQRRPLSFSRAEK
jgi:hypothetical protein